MLANRRMACVAGRTIRLERNSSGVSRTYIAFGTPGGSRIITAVLHTIVNVIDYGMNLQEAIDAPAWHSEHFPSSFWPRTARPGVLVLEGRIPKETVDELKKRGHEVELNDDWSEGRLTAATRDEVIAAIGTKNLVDVRSPDEFSGKILAPAHLPQEQSQRPGHVPSAINVPWSRAANDDGTFKSDEELAKLYADAGLDGEKETIAYCRIGERSAHTWFALHELLGVAHDEPVDRGRARGRR